MTTWLPADRTGIKNAPMVMTMLEHRIGMSARGLENAGAHMRIDVDLVEMESVGACARE